MRRAAAATATTPAAPAAAATPAAAKLPAVEARVSLDGQEHGP